MTTLGLGQGDNGHHSTGEEKERLDDLPRVTKPLSRTRIRVLVAIITFIIIMMIIISSDTLL